MVLLAGSCSVNQSIVNNLEEREANEILVFLASKGIHAEKVASVSTGAAAATGTTAANFDIVVDTKQSTEAMALLNRYGLPRRRGTSLLELFAPSGFMTSDKQETIRYQAGLAEQLCNTIRKIDGVIDADVQLSFPAGEPLPGIPQPKTTAAVYVKHQGILEDPNSHIETKIKRLLAGSVSGLDFENVAVISDRARFADIALLPDTQIVSSKSHPQTYVSLWSIVMTKDSVAHFRLLFFTLIGLLLLLATLLGFMLYRFYPQLLPKKKSEEPPET